VGAGGCRLIPLNFSSRWGVGALGVASIWLLSVARLRVQGWIPWLLRVVDLGRIGLSSNWRFLVLIAFFIRDFIAIYVLLLDFV
jgi:hypothetical protein